MPKRQLMNTKKEKFELKQDISVIFMKENQLNFMNKVICITISHMCWKRLIDQLMIKGKRGNMWREGNHKE